MAEDVQQIVEGECALCGTPVQLVLGERVGSVRWLLAEEVWCPHCNLFLHAALKDQFGRYWGRRRVWND